MRLIDADALYKSLGASGNCDDCPLDARKCQYYNEHTLMEFCEQIDDAPTVDAEPVKHGHWYDEPNYLGTGKTMYFCSYCGSASWREDPYCWHCGSKMDVPDTDVGKKEVKE